MAAVRALGFAVGLHTAGIYPRALRAVLPQLDWVGFDVKALPEHYATVTQVRDSAAPVQESLQALLDSGVAYEVRTTLQPGLHDANHVQALAQWLQAQGVQHFALQQFRATGCANVQVPQHWHPEPAVHDQMQARFARYIWRDAAA
jgi:pyruvate-formate lyase-activating enzyme